MVGCLYSSSSSSCILLPIQYHRSMIHNSPHALLFPELHPPPPPYQEDLPPNHHYQAGTRVAPGTRVGYKLISLDATYEHPYCHNLILPPPSHFRNKATKRALLPALPKLPPSSPPSGKSVRDIYRNLLKKIAGQEKKTQLPKTVAVRHRVNPHPVSQKLNPAHKRAILVHPAKAKSPDVRPSPAKPPRRYRHSSSPTVCNHLPTPQPPTVLVQPNQSQPAPTRIKKITRNKLKKTVSFSDLKKKRVITKVSDNFTEVSPSDLILPRSYTVKEYVFTKL